MRFVKDTAWIKAITADKSKVEVKLLVDMADVGAHEGLVALRGKDAVVSMEQTQCEMEFEDEPLR